MSGTTHAAFCLVLNEFVLLNHQVNLETCLLKTKCRTMFRSSDIVVAVQFQDFTWHWPVNLLAKDYDQK